MYYLLLFATAFLLISIFSTQWPVKLFHHYQLKKLGALLHCEPQRSGLTFSSVYSQIDTVYNSRKIVIRFVEGSVDSLKSQSGMEIRLQMASPVVMEIYNRGRKREWGQFKQFQTGDSLIDSRWFILTNDLETAATFWSQSKLADLLSQNTRLIDQILISRDEMILQLRRFRSAAKTVRFLELLTVSV